MMREHTEKKGQRERSSGNNFSKSLTQAEIMKMVEVGLERRRTRECIKYTNEFKIEVKDPNTPYILDLEY